MEDASVPVHQHDPETMEMVREHLLSADLADRVAGVFWSLADPTRARIVHALTLAELCNADIAELVGLTESAVSHQMRELRLLNIVSAQRHGRMVFYRLNDTHVRHIFDDTLRHVQEDLE
ncbi:MAG: winged helix-turn-helix domain-containing protein [Dehalococcoidia bacterium]|nr:winged helix-turn-helix domain-containing protein [Dehalococcoidia bacterium]